MKIPKIFFLMTTILNAITLANCTNKSVLYSKPSIDLHSGWRWYEACGYECKPMVDFFERDGIKIRIESFNYKTIFTIYSVFISERLSNVTIDPENTYIRLANGSVIYTKATRSGYTKEEYAKLIAMGRNYLQFLRAAEPLRGDLALDTPYGKEEIASLISFFFDVTPPHPSEEFELHINGLKKNGHKVDVPVIKFGPAIRDSGQGIPIDG